MLKLFTGTPGSGKSLHVMKIIYKKLRYSKSLVVTNIPLDISGSLRSYASRIFYLENSSVTPSFLYSHAFLHHERGRESQTLLVIDEAQMLFSPVVMKLKTQENKEHRKVWLDFFSQHRHWGYDVILVTQYDKLIDVQVRCMAEYEVRHRKVNNFKFGLLLSLFRLQLFIAIEYWCGVFEKIDSEFFIFRSKYAKMYNSCSRFSDSSCPGDVVEASRNQSTGTRTGGWV